MNRIPTTHALGVIGEVLVAPDETRATLLLSDAVGLGVLLVSILLLHATVPAAVVPGIMRFFVYIALAFISWNAWRMPWAPRGPAGWLRIAGVMAVGGLIFLMLDVLIGRGADPNLSLLASAERARGFWGFGFTATVFPAVFLIGVAGVARSAYQSWWYSR